MLRHRVDVLSQDTKIFWSPKGCAAEPIKSGHAEDVHELRHGRQELVHVGDGVAQYRVLEAQGDEWFKMVIGLLVVDDGIEPYDDVTARRIAVSNSELVVDTLESK